MVVRTANAVIGSEIEPVSESLEQYAVLHEVVLGNRQQQLIVAGSSRQQLSDARLDRRPIDWSHLHNPQHTKIPFC